jgi:hypothetical protein
MLSYQCLDSPSETVEMQVAQLNKLMKTMPREYQGYGFVSLHYIRQRFEVPHTEHIEHFLVPGPHFIDVHSENAGAGGGCDLSITFIFEGETGEQRSFPLQIDNRFGPTPSQDGTLISNSTEIFHSGGNNNQSDNTERLKPYMTYQAYHLYRTCQRIRIYFELMEDQLTFSSTPVFRAWASQRAKTHKCSLLLNESNFCDKEETENDFIERRRQ